MQKALMEPAFLTALINPFSSLGALVKLQWQARCLIDKVRYRPYNIDIGLLIL
jgi:hypothetical protein